MTPAEQQAQTIYEQICQTSADRPFSGRSVSELLNAVTGWQAANPALTALRQAPPEVHLAFVAHSLEWLRAEARPELRNFRVCQTLSEAIQLAIQRAPKPFPADLMLRLLGDYRQDFSMARMYFPFLPLLSTLTRGQVTDEIRAELRKLHLQFAPSPTGKINERDQDLRDRIADLMRVEGEKQLDPGRGPWSQIVFDEIAASNNEIVRSAWQGLLEHCRSLEATSPGSKWNKRSRELIAALGEPEVFPVLIRWLALGPTPGQPSEARSPIEDSAYQKGVVWCLALNPSAKSSAALADFGAACLRKVPMLGAVSQKVGFACVQALGAMDSPQAISQLARLRAKVKYAVARRLIEKSLLQAAERAGISVEELEDMSVERFGLDEAGVAAIEIAGAQASVHLSPDGQPAVTWKNEAGKLVKSAPAHVRKSFPREVRSVSTLAKTLEDAFRAQRDRLESSFLRPRSIPLAHWRRHFLEHPLLGFLGRRLIWVFSGEEGWERSGLWSDGAIRDPAGAPVDLTKARSAGLWHPLSSQPDELRLWRLRVFNAAVRQPFRQAFREFYRLSEEPPAAMHSNRFAGIILRQHQLSALCRARGWTYRLQGAGFDGVNVPTRELPAWNMHVEFYVDLPSDRDRALLDSGLGEQSGAGINLFVASDQVRFYRDRREIPLEQVPAIVYSEVMRDVDLFASVCAVGDDETWSDQGERGSGIVGRGFDFQEISAVIALRAEMLADVLPLTSIFDRAKIVKSWLEVRGQLGTYRIQLAWDGAALVTDSAFRSLVIPRKLLDAVPLDLPAFPLELDHRSETALRKAHVLANDWKIEDPGLVRQLMPES